MLMDSGAQTGDVSVRVYIMCVCVREEEKEMEVPNETTK